jgi:hypothetical protein
MRNQKGSCAIKCSESPRFPSHLNAPDALAWLFYRYCDDAPVRILSRRADLSPTSASSEAPTLGPESAPPLLGIFSGKPMPDYPVWPSIFATDDRPSPDDDELYQRWRRFLDA